MQVHFRFCDSDMVKIKAVGLAVFSKRMFHLGTQYFHKTFILNS